MKNEAMTATDIGRFGENAAVAYLKKKGYKILERNFRSGHNEIDIIASYKTEIVFFEVKTRTLSARNDLPYGDPLEAVDSPKQKRTLEAASAYLYKSETDLMPRFDILEVYLKHPQFLSGKPTVDRIRQIEDAFGS